MLLQTTGSVATSPISLPTAPAEAYSAGTACASPNHWTGAFAQQSIASRFTGLARYMGEVWLCSALSFHRPSSTLSQHLRFLRTMESAALRRLQAALISDATWQRAAIGLVHARPRACSGAFSLLHRFAKGSGEGRQGWATPRRLSPLRGTTPNDGPSASTVTVC